MKNKFILFLLIAVFLLYSLTVASPEPKKSKKPKEPEVTSSPLVEIPAPPKEKVLIAIAGFENKSTYSADKLWDTSAQLLMSELLKLSYFRVVEWAKMKQLFDWKALSTSSLIKDPGEMAKARKILLCEYFLSGSITRFDVQVRSKVSAIKKKKTYDTTIRVDLLLQDATTGEYLSQGSGDAKAVKHLKGGMGGGQTGMWDPASANDALELAISSALRNLIVNYAKR